MKWTLEDAFKRCVALAMENAVNVNEPPNLVRFPHTWREEVARWPEARDWIKGNKHPRPELMEKVITDVFAHMVCDYVRRQIGSPPYDMIRMQDLTTRFNTGAGTVCSRWIVGSDILLSIDEKMEVIEYIVTASSQVG